MIKTYTLNAIEHEQESPEQGFIAWHLTDENNRKRRVTGITQLSRQGFIKTIRPHNDREIPLVELLSYYVEGESFRVDFSIFNESFGYVPREAFPDMPDAVGNGNAFQEGLRKLFQIPFAH